MNQDLLPGNTILIEVILENRKQIYRVLSLLLVLNRPDACNYRQIMILKAVVTSSANDDQCIFMLTT